MVTRVYVCGQCGYREEVTTSIASSPLSVCPVRSCGAASMRQVYHVPARPLVRGSLRRETPLRRPFVGRERDGSETVYTTLEQAQRGERERAEDAFGGKLPQRAQAQLAKKNVDHMRKYQGLLPGTDAARFCDAVEQRT